MISRTHRFHGHGSLRYLLSGGQTVRTNSLALRFSPNPRRRDYRAAVVVSRKVSKSAVVRNRIRRRLYEHVRILSASFTEPHDFMLIAYDDRLAERPVDKLRADVVQLFERAGMLPSTSSKHAIVEERRKT